MTDKDTSIIPALADKSAVPEDEINLLEIMYVLIKYKTVIILFSVAGLVGGYFAAQAKGPTYITSAAIMAREGDSRQTPNLSGLGMFGGGAASMLGLGGNPRLERIEIHLSSRQFQAGFIEKYDLLDDIFRLGAPKVYRKHYDTTNGRWIEEDGFIKPTPMGTAGLFNKKFLNKDTDAKTGVLTLSVKSADSVFSNRTLENILEHLNYYIRTDVLTDAKSNINFLEQQLMTIADPLLRGRLQDMIAAEIEKMMTISLEAFKILDRPFGSVSFRERKLYPIAAAMGMFMMVSAAVILLHYVFGAGNTNRESQKWVQMIRKQLFRI